MGLKLLLLVPVFAKQPNIITTYPNFAKPPRKCAGNRRPLMLILGIESSCDETGVALYDSEAGLLSHHLHSQVEMHAAYGGVVPELASRDHIQRLIPLIGMVLAESGRTLCMVDAIAVTEGPGLGGALLTGCSVAAGLGAALDKPVVGIHHLEGHLLSPLLAKPAPAFPFVALLVSGGHTQLMSVRKLGEYELLGETLDDAAGEAFDKTATLLGLGYPGGPALSKLAESGDEQRFSFPRPMINSGDLDFSFSGLKTAVLNEVGKLAKRGTGCRSEHADLAAAFQAAVVDVLVAKCMKALYATKMSTLVVSGGVGANARLRRDLLAAATKRAAKVYFPPLSLCTDNGAMIAFAAALKLEANSATAVRGNRFGVRPRWPLATV